MDKITRKHLKEYLSRGSVRKYTKREHYIFTEKEATEEKKTYKPWRECQPGEWGLTDDGFVAQCLKRRVYSSQGKDHTNLEFSFGQVFFLPGKKDKRKLLYAPRRDTEVYTGLTNKPFWELWAQKAQTKRFVDAYVTQFLAGRIDWKQLGTIFSCDEPYPAIKAKALIKKRWVKDMIDKKVGDALTAKGVTREDVIEMLLEAKKIAATKQDAGNITRVAENFIDMFQMKTKLHETKEEEHDYLQLDSVEKAVELEAHDYALPLEEPKDDS